MSKLANGTGCGKAAQLLTESLAVLHPPVAICFAD